MTEKEMNKLAGRYAIALQKAFELRYPASTDRMLSPVKGFKFNPVDLYQLVSGKKGALPILSQEDVDTLVSDPKLADAATIKRGMAALAELDRASNAEKEFQEFMELVQDYLFAEYEASDIVPPSYRAQLHMHSLAGNFSWMAIDLTRIELGELDF